GRATKTVFGKDERGDKRTVRASTTGTRIGIDHIAAQKAIELEPRFASDQLVPSQEPALGRGGGGGRRHGRQRGHPRLLGLFSDKFLQIGHLLFECLDLSKRLLKRGRSGRWLRERAGGQRG